MTANIKPKVYINRCIKKHQQIYVEINCKYFYSKVGDAYVFKMNNTIKLQNVDNNLSNFESGPGTKKIG